MKRLITAAFSLTLIFLLSFIILLSTSGFQTKHFNNFISQKINQNNKNVKLNFGEIKFKLDIKELSLFLETKNPNIFYRNILIPSKNLKVYVNFLSLIKSETKINKVILNLNQINISQLKMLSKSFKPSNFKSFINNKLKDGVINTEIEFYLDKNNSLNNFIARGEIKLLKAKIIKGVELKKTSFSFLADKTDLLVKNFYGESELFTIKEGDIKVDLSNDININANFISIFNQNEDLREIEKFSSNLKNLKYLSFIQAKLNNSINLKFDKTYKIKDFEYRNNGKITKADLNLKNLNLNNISNQKIKQLSFIETDILTNLNSKKNTVNLSGKYSLNDSSILNFKLNSDIKKSLLKIDLTADYDEYFEVKILNYFKSKGDKAKIKFNFVKENNSLKVKQFDYGEGRNSLLLKDVIFSKGKLISFNEVSVRTYKDNIKNNDFSISLNNNIFIKGEKYDARYIPKIFNQNTNNHLLSKISKNIEIDLKNIIAPVSEKLKNFKLVGRIENGEFIKISSKGEFGSNKFLDISIKNDKNNKKKYLEIYSDISKILLSEYKFFEGLTGGNLLFSSVINENSSNSKLRIENFKVINAPGMVKLLSLADLGGLADLAEGEGISFETLEINMEKNKDTLKINEILALGPSVSVLMEGYQDQNVTSLRGTLVPAKTLNTLISKIPVIGDIVIPKEVGEGLFGISFKMKGPPGKIKTTINPIRTITPRFIQKIIDKKKNIR